MTKDKRPLRKHTFKLFDGQYLELERLHPNLPVSSVLRQLIDAYIAKRKSMEAPVELDVEVEID